MKDIKVTLVDTTPANTSFEEKTRQDFESAVGFVKEFRRSFSSNTTKNFYKQPFNYLDHNSECSKYKEMLDGFISKIIQENPAVLRIQDFEGWNLGMICAQNCLTKSLDLALDDQVASCQQISMEVGYPYSGYNMGMFCAQNKLKEQTLKALDNHEASIQQNKEGLNIGLVSARSCMEDCVIKALDNPVASLQIDIYNNNIGSLASRNGLRKAAFKALNSEEASVQQDIHGDNIGTYAAMNGWQEVVSKAMTNETARRQQNSRGWNMAMIAANRDLAVIAPAALNDRVMCEQKNQVGHTFYHEAAKSREVREYLEEYSGINIRKELRDYKQRQREEKPTIFSTFAHHIKNKYNHFEDIETKEDTQTETSIKTETTIESSSDSENSTPDM